MGSIREQVKDVAITEAQDSTQNASTLRYTQVVFNNPTPCTIKSVEGTTVTVKTKTGQIVSGILAGSTTPFKGCIGVVIGSTYFGM